MKLQVKKLCHEAQVPEFAHAFDAGMDLRAVEEITLAPLMRAQVRTGIALQIPPGYVGLIWDKSGLSHREGLKTLGGVIDTEYRGEILVGLVNLGESSYTIERGAKIAQILIQAIEHPEVEVVEVLNETDRGDRGFGSTGV